MLNDKQYDRYMSICVTLAFLRAKEQFSATHNRQFPMVTLEMLINKLALTLGFLNIVFIVTLVFCIVRYFYL